MTARASDLIVYHLIYDELSAGLALPSLDSCAGLMSERHGTFMMFQRRTLVVLANLGVRLRGRTPICEDLRLSAKIFGFLQESAFGGRFLQVSPLKHALPICNNVSGRFVA